MFTFMYMDLCVIERDAVDQKTTKSETDSIC